MTSCPGSGLQPEHSCELTFLKDTRYATLPVLCCSGTESVTSHFCLYNQPINTHLFNSHYMFSTILGAELGTDELNMISISQALSLDMEVARDPETQCTKYCDTGNRYSRLRRADSTLLDGYGEKAGEDVSE